MSKTITIPTNCNPYIVVINNHVYTYRAGETIEVPDEVAEAIEDALELIPKPKRYLSKLAQIANGTLEELTAQDLSGISTISNCAFYSCKALRKVSIPNGITSMGNYAFDLCSMLECVYLPDTPPTITTVTTFDHLKDGCTFYCKSQASLDAYKTAPIWSELTGTYSFVVEA